MKSTQAMRDRIRELMTEPQDDYDRAVQCVLDDLEGILGVAQGSSESRENEITRLATIQECAQIAEDTAPIAPGNFFAARRDQCEKIAARIRSLSLPSTDQAGGK